ncbi:MAG: hypothetical protein AAF602_19615 [Myxococcota bacterium]
MSRCVVTILALGATSTGCSEVCGSPDQLNGRTFASFATPRLFEIEADTPDAFPAGTSPLNGEIEIGFEWASNLPQGPLTVSFDGQPSEDGRGQWSQVNCGNFTATWRGIYTAEDGAVHDYAAAGYFVQYRGQLEGFVSWEEGWVTADGGEFGTYESEVLLRGDEL